MNLFDVDYWSEKRPRKRFAQIRLRQLAPTAMARWTHEVVMLSGRTREEMTAVAAHEYTHLWINENCPPSHHIEGNTIEAICELTAYKLMQRRNNPDMQKHILENPYTNGKIKDLVAVEREGGTDYVLKWVKTSTAETFDVDAQLAPLSTTGAAYAAPVLAGPRGFAARPEVQRHHVLRQGPNRRHQWPGIRGGRRENPEAAQSVGSGPLRDHSAG